MEENLHSKELWDFAASAWKHSNVQHLLLSAQNNGALDVPLCLFAIYCSHKGLTITSASEAVNVLSAQWQAGLITKLRNLRIEHRENIPLKQTLLAAELEAEKQYLALLAALFSALLNEQALSTHDKPATLRHNLSVCSDYAWSQAELNTLLEVM